MKKLHSIILISIIAIALLIIILKTSMNLIFKLMSNTILGFLFIILFRIFGIIIPINWVTLLITIVFGILGTGILGILTFLGII